MRGFALVLILTLMMLLALVALGLLSLSSIALRSSTQHEAEQLARSNARLGLMLALGDIQMHLGPDQKISAVSGILASAGSAGSDLNHSRLTGVWDSRQEVLGETPDYARAAGFNRWLVSSSNPDELLRLDFPKTGTLTEPVVMVAKHAVDEVPVFAGRIAVPNSTAGAVGRLAWWVADENSKGFTNPEDPLLKDTATPSVPDFLAAAGTPGAHGMQAIDIDYPTNTEVVSRVITHRQLMLASSSGESQNWFHDVSPYSKGLLTNVVSGGLRQDLSLYLEQPRPNDPWPNSPGPQALGPNGKYALSELNEYDVLPWKSLYHYYHNKERIRIVDGRPMLDAFRSSFGQIASDQSNPRWNSGVMRPAPVLVRTLIFIGFGSIRNPANPTADPPEYVLRFYTYPVITLWNPYNVDLQVLARELNFLMVSFPMEHKVSINDTFRENFNWRAPDGRGANSSYGSGNKPLLNRNLILKAGEARMLSPSSWNWGTRVGNHMINYMDEVPFNYSQSFAGAEWGNGNPTRTERAITLSKGGASDRVTLETLVSQWDKGGSAYLNTYPSSFDIRGSHADDVEGHWVTYQWGQKICWRYESTTPEIASPDRISRLNQPTATFGELFNAPRPFMVVDVRLKALDEEVLPNKTWRDCIPSHAYQAVTRGLSDSTPYFAQSYKLSFDSINSYQEASSYLQLDPDNPGHTYFGGSHYPAGGQSWITDREILLAPMTSLGQLQHVAQVSCDNMYSSGFYFQNRAIGNSFASPGVPSDQVKTPGWPFCLDMWTNSHGGTIDGRRYPWDFFHTRPNIDRSYAANHLLWDDYFFSSMAAKNDQLRADSEKKFVGQVVRDFYNSSVPLANPRFRPYLDRPATEVIERFVSGNHPTPLGYQQVAANLVVDGAFNINSVSVPAWKTMLAAAHRRNMVVMEANGGPTAAAERANYVVSRFSMPNEASTGSNNGWEQKWQGYHELSEDQLEELAQAIVRQVRERGPFRSLAEFINRRLGPETDQRTRYGALQAALEDPQVSINDNYRLPEITADDLRSAQYQNKTAALGPRHQGAPPYVTQADLLNSIGSIISPRSDTFLIRGYGEARDPAGNILASAWCEAVVQRIPDYVDQRDASTATPANLSSETNRHFGRRFHLTTFRWLSPAELQSD